MPVGWVFPTGEPLARYGIELADGRTIELDVRRRFEVADGIIGWGFLPFAAIGHRVDETLDWRGPYPRQVPGRYAPAGHGGALTVLPGSWGASQTGVADAVPSPDDDVTYWLHAIALPPDAVPVRLHLTPLGGGRAGTSIVIAGLTLFDGTADPLVLSARRQVLVEGTGGAPPEVDLGVVIQARPAAVTLGGAHASTAGPIGWGRREPGAADPAEARPMGRRSSSTSPWRPTRRSRSAAGGSPPPTWSRRSGIRAARSRSSRWPRPTSGSRSGSRRTASWPRPGSGSWPPTAATCRRSATARRSTRPRSRTREPG